MREDAPKGDKGKKQGVDAFAGQSGTDGAYPQVFAFGFDLQAGKQP
jgi:hypothetical protein